MMKQQRLVTPMEFWFHVVRKSMLMKSGLVVAGGAIFLGLYLCGILVKDTSYILLHFELPEGGWPDIGWYVFLFQAIVVVAAFLTRCGVLIREKASEIEPGTPFTVAVANNWPVAETLVQGYEKSEQEQKETLLRPVQKTVGTSPDQLLRPITKAAQESVAGVVTI